MNVIKFSTQSDAWSVKDIWAGLKDTPGVLKYTIGDLQVYIEGELYYYYDNHKHTPITKENSEGSVNYLFTNYSIERLPSLLEGCYLCIVCDTGKNTVTILADAFNRKHLFYGTKGGEFTFSTNIQDVLKGKVEYNQNSLYSYLLLGYTPIKDTFYENVYRLGAEEMVRITGEGVEFISIRRTSEIQEYQKDKMDEYDKLITNAVTSRASSNGNVVMNSGGWDSTSIVYLLRENFEAKDVNSVVIEVMLSDKQSFNVYEVDKVKRISQHFGIKTETVTVDYSDKSVIDAWVRNLEHMRNNHVYFWMHHLKLADEVGMGMGIGKSIFSGEASDSIHNFGFSQFVSVNYDNMFLREYADKAKNYLYGPTFFDKVESGMYSDDKVHQFFKYYYGAERFDEANMQDKTERLNRYLQSFILSYPRVPFSKWQNQFIASEQLNKEYASHLNTTYFSKITDEVSATNLYSNLLSVYKDFHFHSAQIEITTVGYGKHGLSCRMPFLDMKMVEYMAQMPESWGRGLEIRTTKYPLRYLANERWSKMPLNILEEGGPHSYIAEKDTKWSYAGGNWDIYCEILYSSVFREYFKEVLSSANVEKYFDPKLFATDKMNLVIRDYVEGKEDIANHGLLFKLAMLLTIGLFE